MLLETSDGAKIFYQTYGNENTPLVTLVNGHTRSSTDFRILANKLVERGLRVLTLDNRASGQSLSSKEFTLEDMAGDVIALWQELGSCHNYLLGISMGGLIAMKIALSRPELVEKLCLVSTFASSEYLAQDQKGWSDSLPEITAKLKTYFTDEFYKKNQLLVEAMAKQIHKKVIEGEFVKNAAMQRRAMKDSFPEKWDLSQICSETLILHGSEDRIVPIAAAENIEERIHKVRLQVYPAVGHLLLAECSQLLAKDVGEFFD